MVAGISHYGNCFGVPTVGGECVFEECYDGNPLVNVFALGVFKHDEIFYGKATGIGNPVIYVGSKTGRDGIHGASMASAEFTEESKQKRPNVQVGDPFMEKLLLEACLEAMKTGAIVGIQDMGAAGLTCSTCEMGSRAGTGVEIDLMYVPQRELGMTPYEIMLSESPGADAAGGGTWARRRSAERLPQMGAGCGDCRRSESRRHAARKEPRRSGGGDFEPRPGRRSAGLQPAVYQALADGSAGWPGRSTATTLTATSRSCWLPAISANKRWIWEQYDYQVRTNTLAGPGAEAAIVRIKETDISIAMSLDGNGRYCCAGSPRRHEADCGGVLPEPVDGGCAAGSGDEQPQLRQSGAAGDHGATGGID